jgi:uncharacterized protein YqeY
MLFCTQSIVNTCLINDDIDFEKKFLDLINIHKETLKLFKSKLKDETIQLALDNILEESIEETIKKTIDNFINIYLVYKKLRPAYLNNEIEKKINILREVLDIKLIDHIYYMEPISDELKIYISNHNTLSSKEQMTILGKVLGYTFAGIPGWDNFISKNRIIISYYVLYDSKEYNFYTEVCPNNEYLNELISNVIKQFISFYEELKKIKIDIICKLEFENNKIFLENKQKYINLIKSYIYDITDSNSEIIIKIIDYI